MVFYSYTFLLFFLAVAILYFTISHKYRWIILLASSYYFYMCWKAEYVIILAVATLWDYLLAIAIAKASTGGKRKLFLVISLFLNLGTLFLFKYLNLFTGSLQALFSRFNIMVNIPALKLLLPVGISYYTFKKISYIVDVYRDRHNLEKHLGRFALYVSFFPELIAGPIDRGKDLLPQFKIQHRPEFKRIIDGLKLLAWGMFKKVVIADRLAIFVNQVYDHPGDYGGVSLTLATLFFSIQIYADFSGYTDMAIGIAQVLGYRLGDNFDRPYFARSIKDFWRRWHISFTTWLRDYLFLPVAYSLSRRIKKDWVLNIIKTESWIYITGTMITMSLCGLWHGAGWTFIVWGSLHGLYLVVSHLTGKTRKKIRKKLLPPLLKQPYRYLRVFFTFSMVSVLWVFFRAGSISEAVHILSRMFSPGEWGTFVLEKEWLKKFVLFGQPAQEFIIAILTVGFLILIHTLQPHEGMRSMFSKKRFWLRWVFYILLALMIMNLGVVEEVPFIYAEF